MNNCDVKNDQYQIQINLKNITEVLSYQTVYMCIDHIKLTPSIVT